MFKQFLSFQRMLFNSVSTPVENAKLTVATYLLLAVSSFFLVSKGFGITLIVIPAVSFVLLYNALNSDKKIYQLPPVSSKFALINIYLFQPIAMVATYLVFTLGTMIIVGHFVLVLRIIRGNLGQEAPEGTAITETATSFEGIVFVALLYLLIWFAGTTIALIKENRIRRAVLLSSIAVFGAGIEVLDRTLPRLPRGVEFDTTSFLHRFSEASHAPEILIGLGLLTLLVIPISIKVGRKLYNT
ncbi:hypothetical protein [Isachenkonia alkalipeptolytica]|uniref:Uncharacterized protein n=1 Tax=Isachenkonia alkalipeptolytica TaxID=2565777 RepID=A0AA43XL19_9CLOT|nr:hypothetical protein [Isachenkonia alkalipeptolytica]NBG88234.1 hypothetical protein [Isachenkonia alkalipeptolytica]